MKKGGNDLQRELIIMSSALASRAVSEVCSEMSQLPPVELQECKAAAGFQMEPGCRTNPRVLDQAEDNPEQGQGFARAALELFVSLGRAALVSLGRFGAVQLLR